MKEPVSLQAFDTVYNDEALVLSSSQALPLVASSTLASVLFLQGDYWCKAL